MSIELTAQNAAAPNAAAPNAAAPNAAAVVAAAVVAAAVVAAGIVVEQPVHRATVGEIGVLQLDASALLLAAASSVQVMRPCNTPSPHQQVSPSSSLTFLS